MHCKSAHLGAQLHTFFITTHASSTQEISSVWDQLIDTLQLFGQGLPDSIRPKTLHHTLTGSCALAFGFVPVLIHMTHQLPATSVIRVRHAQGDCTLIIH